MKEKINQANDDSDLPEKGWNSSVLENGENRPKKYQILEKNKDNFKQKGYWADWRYLKKELT